MVKPGRRPSGTNSWMRRRSAPTRAAAASVVVGADLAAVARSRQQRVIGLELERVVAGGLEADRREGRGGERPAAVRQRMRRRRREVRAEIAVPEAALLLSARPRRRPGTGSRRRRPTRGGRRRRTSTPLACERRVRRYRRGGDPRPCRARRSRRRTPAGANAEPSTIESSSDERAARQGRRGSRRGSSARARKAVPHAPAAMPHVAARRRGSWSGARRGRRRVSLPRLRSPVEVEALEREAGAGEVEVEVAVDGRASRAAAPRSASAAASARRPAPAAPSGGRRSRAGSRRRGARRSSRPGSGPRSAARPS